MERSPSPKILRLAPDSMFVSFLCPFFIFIFHISFLAFLSFSLPFFSQALRGLPAHCSHTLDVLLALTWGIL